MSKTQYPAQVKPKVPSDGLNHIFVRLGPWDGRQTTPANFPSPILTLALLFIRISGCGTGMCRACLGSDRNVSSGNIQHADASNCVA